MNTIQSVLDLILGQNDFNKKKVDRFKYGAKNNGNILKIQVILQLRVPKIKNVMTFVPWYFRSLRQTFISIQDHSSEILSIH